MRQSIRRALLLVSFFLFPVTIYYFSPVLVIMGALKGIVAASLLVFLVQFLSSLFLGRAFCGWICPAAGLQEASFMVKDKMLKKKGDLVKFIIWVPWLSAIIFSFYTAGGIKTVDPLFMTDRGISVTGIQGYIVLYSFIALIFILSITVGKRAFCHSVCWMAPFMVLGLYVRNRVRWPALRLKSDDEKCSECRRCTYNCPMSLEVHSMVIEKKSMENVECILCGSCVDTCPEKAISYSFSAGK